ncbi:hypothetical protein HU200_011061 [Digitaria exilis]|uniref:Uncharacterized protein n=1 Tax=Digitaria exilis TaxID=1010633 RepID=A0A835FIK6_9POAL|nr:hypothetical protein HU200_011061 [Digitaria exilis]
MANGNEAKPNGRRCDDRRGPHHGFHLVLDAEHLPEAFGLSTDKMGGLSRSPPPSSPIDSFPRPHTSPKSIALLLVSRLHKQLVLPQLSLLLLPLVKIYPPNLWLAAPFGNSGWLPSSACVLARPLSPHPEIRSQIDKGKGQFQAPRLRTACVLHAGCRVAHGDGNGGPARRRPAAGEAAAGQEASRGILEAAEHSRGQGAAPPAAAAPAGGLSAEAFLVLACVAVSLTVLPLVLPPLPPPPPLLLLVPVCLLLLLAALATFVPSDVRTMTSSYLPPPRLSLEREDLLPNPCPTLTQRHPTWAGP